MKKAVMPIFTLTLLLFAASTWAEPYGLKMGMLLEDLDGAPEKIGLCKYVIDTVPDPDPDVESYAVKISPKGGLFWIKAVGHPIATTPDGAEIRRAFERVKRKTAAVYGDSRPYDFLAHGSTLDGPNDWMQGIINWERVLGALWKGGEKEPLPNGLIEVFAGAEAVSDTEGFISVEYTFSNMEACEAELLEEAPRSP